MIPEGFQITNTIFGQNLLASSGIIPYNQCMKNKNWTIELKDIKARQPFAPLQKQFRNKKNYSRKQKYNPSYL
jgi:hypothetical protein